MSTVDQPGSRLGQVDDRPLSSQEYQLLQRLLSDPFSLPMQFKTWLVSYLETSDLNLPLSAVSGLTTLLGITSVGPGGTLGTLPAGLIFPYGGTAAPTGAKMCDGASYSRVTEKRLYDVIGTAFGAPDANTFRVPDIQERIPVGRGSKAEVNALGKNEGKALGSRGPIHGHTKTGTVTISDPGHRHNQNQYGTATTTGGAGPQGAADAGAGGQTDFALTGITASDTIAVGPQTGPIDTVAFLVLNFIIVS